MLNGFGWKQCLVDHVRIYMLCLSWFKSDDICSGYVGVYCPRPKIRRTFYSGNVSTLFGEKQRHYCNHINPRYVWGRSSLADVEPRRPLLLPTASRKWDDSSMKATAGPHGKKRSPFWHTALFVNLLEWGCIMLQWPMCCFPRRKLVERGWSIQWLQPQHEHDALSALVATLESQFGCLVGVNAYLTPAGAQGQAVGEEKWWSYYSFRSNPMKNSMRNLSFGWLKFLYIEDSLCRKVGFHNNKL